MRDEYEIMLRDLERIDDDNELARFLLEYDMPPGDPRVDALLRRAMAGTGRYSLFLRARHGVDA
jgi:hypothetical protein